MKQIGYNSQRNNYSFGGTFKAFWQCFSTSAWMLMSFYSSRYKADDDQGLAEYLDDVEWTIGKRGIAEKTIQKLKFKISGGSSYWWLVQKAGIEVWLSYQADVVGECVFYDGTMPIAELADILKTNPVILATNKLGGLPGGHIILAVGYNALNDSLICNDPFGNARVKYQSENGEGVEYPIDWLKPYIEISKGKCRCMYFNKS
jgi:hypothetical protein